MVGLLMHAPEDAEAQTGAYVGGLESDRRAQKKVRKAFREVNKSLRNMEESNNEMQILRTSFEAKRVAAQTELKECEKANPRDHKVMCRYKALTYRNAKDEMNDTLIESVEKNQPRFDRAERQMLQRVTSLVEDPNTYRHMLSRGNRALVIFTASINQLAKYKAMMNEAVAAVYLAGILQAMDNLNKVLATMRKSVPEIGQIIDEHEHSPPVRDELSTMTYATHD